MLIILAFLFKINPIVEVLKQKSRVNHTIYAALMRFEKIVVTLMVQNSNHLQEELKRLSEL
jgi:hypothetical protein